jgi:hypothetical protein
MLDLKRLVTKVQKTLRVQRLSAGVNGQNMFKVDTVPLFCHFGDFKTISIFIMKKVICSLSKM